MTIVLLKSPARWGGGSFIGLLSGSFCGYELLEVATLWPEDLHCSGGWNDPCYATEAPP